MQIYPLLAHPNFAPAEVHGVSVRWNELPDGRLMLRYRVDGCAGLEVPGFHGMGRGNDLWKTTCFELFLYDGDGCYREFNFSPSQQWAAYRFAGYRNARQDFEPKVAPVIRPERGDSIFMLTVFIAKADVEGSAMGALAAVIEEKRRRPSYWAMAHHKLEPDFHDPASFLLATASAGKP